MANIQKLISEPVPTAKDIRLRKISPGEWVLVIAFKIGEENFHAVRTLTDKPALVTALKDLAVEAIQTKVVELGYTVS